MEKRNTGPGNRNSRDERHTVLLFRNTPHENNPKRNVPAGNRDPRNGKPGNSCPPYPNSGTGRQPRSNQGAGRSAYRNQDSGRRTHQNQNPGRRDYQNQGQGHQSYQNPGAGHRSYPPQGKGQHSCQNQRNSHQPYPPQGNGRQSYQNPENNRAPYQNPGTVPPFYQNQGNGYPPYQNGGGHRPPNGPAHSGGNNGGGRKPPKKPKNWALIIPVILLGIFLLVLLVAGGLWLKDHYFGGTESSSDVIDQALVDRLADITTTNGEMISISDSYSDDKVTNETEALESVKKISSILGISDINTNLSYNSSQELNGDTYYQFDEYLNGIRVYGRELTVMADETGNILGLSTNYQETEVDSPENTISKEEVTTLLKEHYNQEIQYLEEPVLLYYEYEGEMHLCWYSQMKNPAEYAFADAFSGEILEADTMVCFEADTYTQDGYTINISRVNGTNYYKDTQRKLEICDTIETKDANGKKAIELIEANPVTSSFKDGKADKTALKVQEMVAKAYDYFAGKGVYRTENGLARNYKIRVNVNKCRYQEDGKVKIENMKNNACWTLDNDWDLIVIGQKSANENIVWHEYTHSIVYNYVTLAGQTGESGTLNEGISDVFGELIEASENGSCDWLHGDRSAVSYTMKASEVTDKIDCHDGISAVSHIAYYQDMNGFSYDQIADLWLRTLKLMPDGSKFDEFCFIMEAEAARMAQRRTNGFNDAMVQATRQVFEELEYTDKAKKFFEYVSPDFELQVLNKWELPSYDINLEIKGCDISDGAKASDYSYEYSFHEPETVSLHLENGMYQVTVWDKMKVRKVLGYVISRENGSTSLNIQEKFLYTISGKALEKDSNKPLYAATVAYSMPGDEATWYRTTEADGSYWLYVPIADYDLKFTKKGYKDTSLSVSVNDFRELNTEEQDGIMKEGLAASYGIKVSDVYLEKDRPVLTGSIQISSADMNPDNVIVRLADGREPDEWTAKTEPFSFYDLPGGSTQTAEFYYNNYLCKSVTDIVLDEDGFGDMGTVLLEPLSVYVNLKSADGSTLKDAYVQAVGTDGTVWYGGQTGGNAFELILPPGEYQLKAGASGCEEVTENVQVYLGHAEFELTVGNGNWRGAYAEVVRVAAGTYANSGGKFCLAYIDDDDIPELIIAKGNAHVASCEVYAWYQGQAVKLGEFGDYGSVAFVPHSGILYAGRWINGCGELQVYFTIGQGQAILEDTFGELYDQNTGETYYAVNDNRVSQAEYEAKVAQWMPTTSALLEVTPLTVMADFSDENITTLETGNYPSLVAYGNS